MESEREIETERETDRKRKKGGDYPICRVGSQSTIFV